MRTMTKVAVILALVGVLAPVLGGAGSPGHEATSEPARPSPAKAPAKSEKKPKAEARPAENEHEEEAEAASHEPARKPAPRVKDADSEPPTAEIALGWLREGNARWVSESTEDPNISPERRQRLTADGQKPFATIITCADSRVPVERVFDRGVGDLFVVRVAGNIAGRSETGTIEYGVGHLGTPLLVVMGHTKCGAVAAAASGARVHGAIADLIGAISPAVERARRQNPGASEAELAAAAVKENVWQTIFDLLKSSDECREAVISGKLTVVGAVYDISSGRVDVLGEHPWQSQLIDAFASRSSPRSEPAPAARAAPAHETAAAHDEEH